MIHWFASHKEKHIIGSLLDNFFPIWEISLYITLENDDDWDSYLNPIRFDLMVYHQYVKGMKQTFNHQANVCSSDMVKRKERSSLGKPWFRFDSIRFIQVLHHLTPWSGCLSLHSDLAEWNRWDRSLVDDFRSLQWVPDPTQHAVHVRACSRLFHDQSFHGDPSLEQRLFVCDSCKCMVWFTIGWSKTPNLLGCYPFYFKWKIFFSPFFQRNFTCFSFSLRQGIQGEVYEPICVAMC